MIRGPGVMDGYLANDEANAEAFVDGWFRTGDQGRFDGRLPRLVGRLKEMIIRGGENISPLEVEDVLLRHPAVSEAVAFGVPDAKYGAARRLPRSSLAASALTRPTLSRTAASSSRRSRFRASSTSLDAIPKTPTGKVQRPRMPRALRRGLMRFAILGAGAIGAYVGAALARGGADVVLIARGPHLEALQRDGVRVLSDRGDFAAQPPRPPTISPRSPTRTSSCRAQGLQHPRARAALGELLDPATRR